MTYAIIDHQTYIAASGLIQHTANRLEAQMRRESWDLKSEDIRKLKLTLALLKTQITLMETNIESHETDTTATH